MADGRQSRRFGRQPGARMAGRARWPGAVGECRRPRRVHHFLAERLDRVVESADLDRGTSPRPRRAVAQEQLMARPPTVEPHVERPGPAEFRDPFVRRELAKAAIWLGMALLIVGVIVLGQPLLLIIGGLIFAVFRDGGVRLLGRFLPIPRGWRLLIVLLLGFGFLGWVVWFAGTTIGAQFEALREVVTAQFDRLIVFAKSLGLMPRGQPNDLGSQLLGGVGRLTSAVGSVIGAVASVIAMLVIGIFLASEPRLYDRGIAWMLPLRAPSGFSRIA